MVKAMVQLDIRTRYRLGTATDYFVHEVNGSPEPEGAQDPPNVPPGESCHKEGELVCSG